MRVPHVGSSLHEHTVDVGGDSLAHITFKGATFPITLHMGGARESGDQGSINWETKNATIGLSVHEEGTAYELNGDGVSPPA